MAATHVVVTTHREYVFAELAEAARRRPLPIVRDYGLDVPSLPAGSVPAWWVPSGHAVRLAAQGVPLTLTAPGPRWLEALPAALRGRTVFVRAFADLAPADFPSFAKPAESKLEHLPAQWWTDLETFQVAARTAGLFPESLVQLSAPLDIVHEVRFLIVHGQVLAGAPYRSGSDLYFPGMQIPKSVQARMSAFVQDVAAVPGPAGLVVDVAFLKDGSVCVLEPNPGWCAYWYDCPTDAALQMVEAATDPAFVAGWEFRPDPVLLRTAQRLRPLPLRQL